MLFENTNQTPPIFPKAHLFVIYIYIYIYATSFDLIIFLILFPSHFFFYFVPSFLKFYRFDLVESGPFSLSERNKINKIFFFR